MKIYNNNNKGFSLVEMLVVISIIGIMSSVAIPKIGSLRENAKKTKDIRNAMQIDQMMTIAIENKAISIYEPGNLKIRKDKRALIKELSDGVTITLEDSGLNGTSLKLPLSEAQIFYASQHLVYKNGFLVYSSDNAEKIENLNSSDPKYKEYTNINNDGYTTANGVTITPDEERQMREYAKKMIIGFKEAKDNNQIHHTCGTCTETARGVLDYLYNHGIKDNDPNSPTYGQILRTSDAAHELAPLLSAFAEYVDFDTNTKELKYKPTPTETNSYTAEEIKKYEN